MRGDEHPCEGHNGTRNFNFHKRCFEVPKLFWSCGFLRVQGSVPTLTIRTCGKQRLVESS